MYKCKSIVSRRAMIRIDQLKNVNFMNFSLLNAYHQYMRGKKSAGDVAMRSSLVRMIALIMLIGGFSLDASAKSEITLSFGVYSSDKPSSMVRQFRPVLNALERQMAALHKGPVRIQMHVAKSYEQGVKDLVTGKVDFSRFGPASYIEAKDGDPRIKIIVVESNNGSKVFNGVICVDKDSEITQVTQLRGKTFAFGDERSTIGRYLAQLHLLRHGMRVGDLGNYEYLGRHDAVGAAVGAGRFAAGALKESTFMKLVRDGVPLRAIAKFPNVTKPWIARGGLPDLQVRLLREALLTLDNSKAMKSLAKDGFLVGTDDDYAFIREAMLGNQLFFKTQRPSIANRAASHAGNDGGETTERKP